MRRKPVLGINTSFLYEECPLHTCSSFFTETRTTCLMALPHIFTAFWTQKEGTNRCCQPSDIPSVLGERTRRRRVSQKTNKKETIAKRLEGAILPRSERLWFVHSCHAIHLFCSVAEQAVHVSNP